MGFFSAGTSKSVFAEEEVDIVAIVDPLAPSLCFFVISGGPEIVTLLRRHLRVLRLTSVDAQGQNYQ